VTSPRIGQVAPQTVSTDDPIQPVYIPELTADKISTGSLTAATITVGDDGRIVAGDAVGSRTELNADGLFGYKDNTEIFHLADGELRLTGYIYALGGEFTGTVSAATILGSDIQGSQISGGTITIGTGDAIFRASNFGIQLGSGSFPDAPFRVTPDGTMYATNAYLSGTVAGSIVSGSVITGSIVTGSVVRTAESGQRLELNIGGLYAYGGNTSNPVTTIDAATGVLTATSAVITGTVSTAPSGSRAQLGQDGLNGSLRFYAGYDNETPAGITSYGAPNLRTMTITDGSGVNGDPGSKIYIRHYGPNYGSGGLLARLANTNQVTIESDQITLSANQVYADMTYGSAISTSQLVNVSYLIGQFQDHLNRYHNGG
jgi:hypothetical protein